MKALHVKPFGSNKAAFFLDGYKYRYKISAANMEQTKHLRKISG